MYIVCGYILCPCIMEVIKSGLDIIVQKYMYMCMVSGMIG